MKSNSTSKLFADRRQSVYRRSDLRLALLETVKSFCRKTSVHGMKFIVDEESDEDELFRLSSTRKKVSQLIWFLICLMGISMAIGLVVTFYGKFQTRPIMTSIDTTTYPIWGLDFPGVTICNINKVHYPRTKNITEKLLARGITQENITNFYTNLSKLIEFERMNETYVEIFNDIQLELTRIGLNMEKLMKTLAQPCSSLLIYCEWIENSVPCETLFRMTKSSEGFCCSFNYIAIKDKYEVETSVHNEQPYRVAGAGRGSGLAVVLDLGTENYLTASRPFYGSEIIIHDPNDFPQTSFSTTIVQPGYVGELMITPTLIESQEIIESVAPEQRRCYLKAEKKLRTTNHYSFKSCITECRVDRIQQICRCVPFYYPETDLVEFAYSSRVCTLADVQCLYENRHIFSSIKPEVNVTGLSENTTSGLTCEGCLPSCSRQSYLVSQALAVRNFNNAGKVKRVETAKNKTDLSVVYVYFKDIVCIKYTRDTLMKWDDLFASFGGVFGLCIGGSVISFIEFIYFFTFKFLSNLRRRKLTSAGVAPPIHIVQKTKVHLNADAIYAARGEFLRRPPINNRTLYDINGKQYLP